MSRYIQSAPVLVAKLNQMQAKSLEDAEVVKAFAGCVLSSACIDATKELAEIGYIFFDDVQNKCRINAEKGTSCEE